MTKVTDTFDRADSTSLGANWTEVVGDWAIVSNQCECNDDDGATGYYARHVTDVGSSDMYAEVVTNSTQTDGSSNTGPAVRMRAAANTSYQFTTNLNDSCAFWRIVAGTETQITTFTTAIAVGDRARLEAVGRTLRAKVNDSLVAVTQDTNITDGQRGGLNGYNNVGTDVVRINNFEAGALTDDLVAAYVADWSAQTARVTTATSTPTIPAQVAAGDLVCVVATVRATTSAISAPAGQGWSQVELASGNSLRMYLFAKIWGLGGQTDDTTPDFTKDTGSVGWFTTAFIIRNPLHASRPWTSVGAAIVASGQQSNAAAATATAPSVTHDGSNRTLVRLFSSADDNALATPSEGALIFGGAAYDATDISQAMTIREDVTVATSTGTATVAETVNGNDASNGITLVVAIPTPTVNATASAPLGGSFTGAAVPTVLATLAAPLGGTATLTAVPTVHATLTATLGGTGSATATRTTSATAAAGLGGTGSAMAVRSTSAVASSTFGGTATATAGTTALATAALGGTAAAAATVQRAAVASSSLGGTGTATATRATNATAAGSLGGSASATALVAHPAIAASDFGGSASATATTQRSATTTAPLGGVSAAAATVNHPATAAGSFGFNADAFAGGGAVVNATAAAALGASVGASAAVTHIAQAVAALGGSTNATAIAQHEAVLAALLGGVTTATAQVQRNATALAALGFNAAASVGQDDPNPVHVAFADAVNAVTFDDADNFALTEAVGVRIEEMAA